MRTLIKNLCYSALIGTVLCTIQPTISFGKKLPLRVPIDETAPSDNNLAPHKAIYVLKMVSKKSGAAVLNVGGNMFYDWRPVCDAWITDHRFNITYEYADTPSITMASDFSTYELIDGSSFDFNSSRKRGDKVVEEIRKDSNFS